MSDVTSHTVESVPVQNVRRGRGRRSAPREVGADLLQVTSRVTEEEARVLAQARAILLKLSAGGSRPALPRPQLVRGHPATLLASQEGGEFGLGALGNPHRV